MAICSTSDTNMCYDLTITHNIVAGAPYAGYIVPGHKCGDYSKNTFKHNTVHSIAGSDGGMGALIYPDLTDSTQSTCYEASYLTTYKNLAVGAFGYFKTKHVILSYMTSMDNKLGLGPHIGGSKDYEYVDLKMEVKNNMIYGETEAKDCPS